MAATGAACSSQTSRLTETSETIDSLRSTTMGIGEAWLHGDVSGTYAEVALDETFRLLDKALIDLHAVRPVLVDPRGAQLSIRAEALSRSIARVMADINAGDGRSAREDLAAIATLEKRPK